MGKINCLFYGQPLVGKSYLANSFPNTFTINTDGNARHFKNDYVLVTDYMSFSKALVSFDDKKYDTLIIDLMDHVYEFARTYFLDKNKIEHESELGFGKGWAVIEKGFIDLLMKIATFECNVVLLFHERVSTEKDKFNREVTSYSPQVREKVVSKITGLMDYVGRVYKDEKLRGTGVETDYFVSFGGNANEISGVRLPIGYELKERIIGNNYDELIKNVIKKKEEK